MTTSVSLHPYLKPLPLVAVLRGITPGEIVGVSAALCDNGFHILEVPLNSPQPLDSIGLLAKQFGERCLTGAGTVLRVEDVARGLNAVAAAVESVGERFGVARAHERFTGHVTVGRSKGRGVDAGAALERFRSRVFGATTIDEVHLYESRLGGEGSTYVLRSRAALGSN